MATLVLATEPASWNTLKHERVRSLREWLDGQWAALFSHPEDFAPHPSTPHGFTTCLADGLTAAGIKPLVFGTTIEQPSESWFDHALDDDSVVALKTYHGPVVDLAECALATRLATLRQPFVLILDEHSRCRTTLRYATNANGSPRTIVDVIEIVGVLQHGPRVRNPELRTKLA